MSDDAREPDKHSVFDKIGERDIQLAGWLQENAPYVFADQKHLDANSVAQAYWHYGYMVALRDVQKQLLADYDYPLPPAPQS